MFEGREGDRKDSCLLSLPFIKLHFHKLQVNRIVYNLFKSRSSSKSEKFSSSSKVPKYWIWKVEVLGKIGLKKWKVLVGRGKWKFS